MRSKKRLILLSAITVVLLLSINIAASAKTKVSLLMVDLEGPVRPIVLEELIPEFERLNPDIEVEVELASWTGYTEKLQTLFVSGLIPDVFQCGATGTILADYATRGLLLPLEDEIEDWEDWPQAAIEDVTFEGHMYGVPYRLDLRPFWWRKDHFEEAGLGREAKPRTWDEMIEAAQKLTVRRADGQFERAGVHQKGDYPGWWWYSLYQAGGRLFNDDYTKTEVNSSAGIDSMQFYVDISNKYELCPPTGMPSVGAEPLVSGRASMQYNAEVLILQMKDQFPEDLEHLGVGAPLQRYEDTEPATSVFINKYAVHKGTKNKEAALRLLNWLTSEEVMGKLAAWNNQIPARQSLWETLYGDDPMMMSLLDNMQYARSFPQVVGLAQMLRKILPDAMNDALYENKTPKQALDDAARDIDRLLRRNR